MLRPLLLSQLQILVRHGAFAGAGHMGGEFGEHAARIFRRGFLPRLLALGQFLRGHVQRCLLYTSDAADE